VPKKRTAWGCDAAGRSDPPAAIYVVAGAKRIAAIEILEKALAPSRSDECEDLGRVNDTLIAALNFKPGSSRLSEYPAFPPMADRWARIKSAFSGRSTRVVVHCHVTNLKRPQAFMLEESTRVLASGSFRCKYG
jgi:hypothetical protein